MPIKKDIDCAIHFVGRHMAAYIHPIVNVVTIYSL